MLMPTVVVDICKYVVGLLAEFRGWEPGERGVSTMIIVIVFELTQFSLKVKGVPEGHLIKILTPADR